MMRHLTLPENLDCYTVDPQDLYDWADTLLSVHLHYGVGKSSARLLAQYARNLARSMECRLGLGSLREASMLERKNHNIYRRIPQKYRW